MKNEIIVKEKVTMTIAWDKVRIYINRLHPNFRAL